MLISILSFLAVFTTVVLVHELGHFLAARRSGVPVYEFSIGFPFSPKIAVLFRHRETEFTLRLLPLGGFVSFSREGDEEADGLFSVSDLRRAMILAAGPMSNIVFAFLVLTAAYAAGKHIPVADAVLAGARTVWAVIDGTITFLLQALTGRGSWEGLSGPVGIAVLAGKAAEKGILNLLYFTGMLSMSLGIMNLLPFPALDGGQLTMLFIERVRRRRLSIRTYQTVNALGMVLFLILTVMVTWRDVVRVMA